MKKIVLALFTLLLAGSVMAQSSAQKVTFYVNYHCEKCIKKIEENLPFEKGVTDFKTDLKGKSIEITYNSKRTDPEKLRKAIEKLGFVVKDSYDEMLKHLSKH